MVGTRKAEKRTNRMCGFCGGPEGEQYIYPVPREYRTHSFAGLMACAKCFPAVRQAQIDEGIFATPTDRRLETHWKE